MKTLQIGLATVLLLVVSGGNLVRGAAVILNEYNAVGGDRQLDNGDPLFGTINGNGGNWFELLVVDDHLDVRGWTLNWTEDEAIDDTGETAAGTLLLSDDPLWSDLRSGTILTFIETADANGQGIDTSTNRSYDPTNGDWWINVATRQEQALGAAGLVSTTTNDGSPGDFSVGNDDWTLTIRDAANQLVFGPVGEGADWQGDPVSSSEAGSLEGPTRDDNLPVTLQDYQQITPTSTFYDDTNSTSFGAANVDFDAGTFTTIQDLSPLRSPTGLPPGAGDFDNDQQLTAADIDALNAAIRTGATDLTFDLNNDSQIDTVDRDVWVEQVRNTWYGDANLDGEFTSSDFVLVFQAGEFEDAIDGNSSWATGDWNGDGDFGSSDFVLAFQAGGFEQGPRGAVAAVPEPSTGVIALGGLALLVGFVRRRIRVQ